MALNITYAAPSVAPFGGTIELKENGTYNITDYAVANVNVDGGGGSSDFSTATVTFNPRPQADYKVIIPFLDDPSGIALSIEVYPDDEPFTVNTPIYKEGATHLYTINTLNINGDIEYGGSSEILGMAVKVYYILGDCTIS